MIRCYGRDRKALLDTIPSSWIQRIFSICSFLLDSWVQQSSKKFVDRSQPGGVRPSSFFLLCRSKRQFSLSCAVQKLSSGVWRCLHSNCLQSCQRLQHVICEKHVFLIVVYSRLGCRFRPSVALVGECLFFRPKFWRIFCSAEHFQTVAWTRLVTIVRSPDILVLFLCGSHSWWRCRFQGCIIKAWSESLDTAFGVVDASAKKNSSCEMFPSCVGVSSSFVAQGGFHLFVHIEFCVKTHPSWHGQCLSCVVIVSIAILSLFSSPLLRSVSESGK